MHSEKGSSDMSRENSRGARKLTRTLRYKKRQIVYMNRNTQSAQPEFSGPSMYKADAAAPGTNYAKSEFSGPTMHQANTAKGSGWSTGLFDSHEDEKKGPSIHQANTASAGANYAEAEFPGATMQQANTIRGTIWSTGLFDCHEDETNAVMTAFLPCVTFGQIAEVMDEGEMSCPLGSLIYGLMMPALCSQWLMGSTYRTRLRQRYNLVEAPYTDIISHVFCSCCSLCQEFRELKKRGLDPSLGWNGILAQRQATQNETMGVPPPRQTML